MLDELARKFYFNWYALPVLLVAGLIPLTGFYIYLQNKKSVTNLSFFLLCIAILLWLMGQTGVYMARDEELARLIYRRLAFAGVVLISPTVYFFSTLWLGLYQQRKKSVVFGIAGAIFFYGLGLFSEGSFPGMRRYYWGYYPVYGINNMIFLVFFFSYFFAAFYNFVIALKEETEKISRIQIKLILTAFAVSFLSSLDYVPKLIYFPLYPLGFLYVFIWITLVAYAIIRYKAMDIETVIHKTLMWFLSTVVAVAPFAALIYFSQGWVRKQPVFLSTALSLTLMLVFYSYFRALQPWLDRVFRSRMVNLNKVSNRFASELVHLKSLRDLLQYTARILRKTVFAETVSIYLRSTDEQELRPAIMKRIRGLASFPADHPFLRWLEAYDDVVVSEFMEGHPELAAIKSQMQDYLSATQAVAVVPFVLSGKLIGVLHLGRKESLKPYTAEEVLFLGRMKSALTIAFSNSLQFIAMRESLEKWNEELEKKVDERTRQLKDTQSQLVQAEKLATIGTLAGGVAHEINNPLTAVLANAQLLKMTALSDDLESISLIEDGARRCQTIIQKLMKYARKPIGPELLTDVDIQLVISNTVALLLYQLEQDNINVRVNKLEKKICVKGNANELEQVFMNLILNAKDAIKLLDCKGIIAISVVESSQNVTIDIEDNGVGIPNDNIKKIFDPFFTTKELGKGTGLGLSVSYGIIKKHFGEINVLRRTEVGTIFRVILPRCEAKIL